MRADARRNYDRLLEQAKLAFAESGVDASLDEIARRAGVASGTLYRHFPTRLHLIEAVLADQIAGLVTLGEELLAADDAFEALATWLRATLQHGLTYRGLAAAVMNSALDAELVSTWHARLFEVGTRLVTRAGDVIVAGTDPEDVVRMVGAIAWATQENPDRAERMLTLLLNGLRR